MIKIEKRPRPEPGKTVTGRVWFPVCRLCGYRVDEHGLGCCYGCEADGMPRTNANTLHAIYERTDKFLGDEDFLP